MNDARRYKYGETIEVYELLALSAKHDLTVRLTSNLSAAILREFEHLKAENRELADKLTQVLTRTEKSNEHTT